MNTTTDLCATVFSGGFPFVPLRNNIFFGI